MLNNDRLYDTQQLNNNNQDKKENISIVEGKIVNNNGFYDLKVQPHTNRFYSDESNYGIYICYDLDRPEVKQGKFGEQQESYSDITILGNMPKLTLGRDYMAVGELVHNKNYGEQFKIHSIFSNEVNTSEDEKSMIYEFVSQSIYDQIVELYEFPITSLLKGEFDYNKINGMGKTRYSSLLKKANDSQKYIKAMNELSGYGISFNVIKSIVERYGSSELAVKKVKENPYILYHDVKGIGFHKADTIAKAVGLQHNCLQRILAGIVYALELEEYGGNTWGYIKNVKDKAEEVLCLSIKSTDFDECFQDKMFYVDEQRIAMKQLWNCENIIAEELNRIYCNNVKHLFSVEEVEENIIRIEKELNIKYTDKQKKLFYIINDNNISVLTGYAGTGKCVHGDTYIYTDKGMIKIKDIPKHYDVSNTSCTSNVISYNLNGSKNISKTSNWYDIGISDTIKIKTSQGYEIEGTYEHPIIIMDVDGNLKFKKIADIINTDIIAVSKNNNLWGDNFVDLDIAYVMGVLIGDGSLNGVNYKNSSYQISYSKTDNYMSSNINGILYEKFPITKIGRRETENKSSVEHVFSNKQTHNQLSDLGMCWTTSEHKYIPESILTSKKECVASFLQGLFDTDASVSTKGIIEYSTASYLLAKQVHLILLNFGIISRLHTKNVKGKDYYIIDITSEFLRQFKYNIGFRFCLHKLSNLNLCLDRNINPNLDVLYYQNNNIKNNIHKQILGKPYYKKHNNNYNIKCKDGMTRSLMHIFDNRGRNCSNYLIKNIIESIDISNPMIDYLYNISNNIFFDKIQSIEQGKANVYDFTVENTHNFISNGFISHNTFTLNGCLKMVEDKLFNIVLCSPAAKAAKVLSKSTNRTAKTIHRTLGWKQGMFEYNKHNKLRCDLMIVDEASMVDIYLFKNLLEALPDGCRLIIVGDTAQLESVSVGNVLHDVINSKCFPVVALTDVFRQALDSGILNIATMIRQGKKFYKESDYVLEDGVKKDFKAWFGVKDESCKRVKMFYSELMKSWNIEDILVVSPMKVGQSGIVNLNKELQEVVNPPEKYKKEINTGKFIFRVGDKVRHTKNDYRAEWLDENYEVVEYGIGVFNGDFGVIKEITRDNIIYVDYGDMIIEYGKPYKNLDLAYAITVHSSQGSQSPVVIGVIDTSHYMNLKRNLLYTMFTRAESKLYVVADKKALGIAMWNNTIPKKQTFLEERIKEIL
jgi:ATP-dependent exoDNAse (exonuclease V) alpha subunit